MTIKINRQDLPKTSTPIFSYCRELIKAGYTDEDFLEVYNGKDNAWDVRCSIGKCAELGISEEPRLRIRKYSPPSNLE